MSKQQLPEPGMVGRFTPCPANGDTHGERLALEIKRTIDKNKKVRYHAVCPLCRTRVFFNNWKPGPRSMTIVQAEACGLHPVGVSLDRKQFLLEELGLQIAPAANNAAQAWPSVQPPTLQPDPRFVR